MESWHFFAQHAHNLESIYPMTGRPNLISKWRSVSMKIIWIGRDVSAGNACIDDHGYAMIVFIAYSSWP
jgi:hypothetical protein